MNKEYSQPETHENNAAVQITAQKRHLVIQAQPRIRTSLPQQSSLNTNGVLENSPTSTSLLELFFCPQKAEMRRALIYPILIQPMVSHAE